MKSSAAENGITPAPAAAGYAAKVYSSPVWSMEEPAPKSVTPPRKVVTWPLPVVATAAPGP